MLRWILLMRLLLWCRSRDRDKARIEGSSSSKAARIGGLQPAHKAVDQSAEALRELGRG